MTAPIQTATAVKHALARVASPSRAVSSRRFFKTGPGQYGEGDQFIGVTVPQQRQVAKQFRTLPLTQVERLLQSPIHEHRLTALLILVDQFESATQPARRSIIALYKKNLRFVNNWDLVDGSAPYLLGVHLLDKSRTILYRYARFRDLWCKRVAIISTYGFIKAGEYEDTLAIAEILLHDPHDLIHKAVGWMLREVGNRDKAAEVRFLKRHAATMPRTALRYAIERFPAQERAKYMKK